MKKEQLMKLRGSTEPVSINVGDVNIPIETREDLEMVEELIAPIIIARTMNADRNVTINIENLLDILKILKESLKDFSVITKIETI